MFVFLILILTPVSVMGGHTFRIFNSTETIKGESLYFASVRIKHPDKGVGNYLCGGALISPRMVLTAAKCVHYNTGVVPIDKLQITGGSQLLDHIDKTTYVGKVSEIIVHPKHNAEQPHHDIAILKLERPISGRHPTFKPIIMARRLPALGTQCFITGFGHSGYNKTKMSQTLRIGQTYIISAADCRESYADLAEAMLCTGKGSTGCLGDSGGPLECEGKLVGIISFSSGGCGKTASPTVYSDVSKFIEWITTNGGRAVAGRNLLIVLMGAICYFNK